MKKNLVLFAALTAAAHAGPRTSANYTIATDTADTGGKRTTSASYTNDGSVGGVAGLSTVAAPAETAKSGYIGQLYEVTGLTLTAASLNVNETATLQLAAWQVLDDATFLAVPAASVVWSVANGPLTGISASGLATAGVVFQNTSATAQGVYLGDTGTLGLTIVNVNLDDFGTYASDGIDDAWQVQYFGLNNPNAGPLLDPDFDGQTNADEWSYLTNPTSSSSVFLPIATRSGANLLITFASVQGRTYTLQQSDTLAPDSWSNAPNASVTGDGTAKTFTSPTTANRRFLRILANP